MDRRTVCPVLRAQASLASVISVSGSNLTPGHIEQYSADFEFGSFYRYNIGTQANPQAVALDETKGPWLKQLINPQAGLYRPGKIFWIKEWVSVGGTDSWSTWTEEFRTVGWGWQVGLATAFNVSVFDSQGQGRAGYDFADITFENDGTKMTIDFTPKLPGGGNPGDYMIIEKGFLGLDIPGTPPIVDSIVELAQYPTAIPEAATLGLLLIGGLGLVRPKR